ncbi:MAG TPA: rhomboid family intramembrane serine protease [Longimicrobiales bacterium]|nr:rhomboid family intramembrane serine protease [Longimicrobiales bacterium]
MTKWVGRLLLANIAVFVLTEMYRPQVMRWFALVPLEVLREPWTPVTYMFLHANTVHLIFNMVGIFFFGPRLEVRLGGRDFARLYFLSGLVAAGFSLIFSPFAAVIGASGAVFGILIGYALFWPDEPIYLYFVIPVPAMVLVVAYVGISVFGGFSGAQDGVAHFAHLGGFVGGWAYLRWRRRKRGAAKESRVARIQRFAEDVRGDSHRWEAIEVDALHEINRAEVNRLFDKIRESGPSSLSHDERAFLDRMAAR